MSNAPTKPGWYVFDQYRIVEVFDYDDHVLRFMLPDPEKYGLSHIHAIKKVEEVHPSLWGHEVPHPRDIPTPEELRRLRKKAGE
ncbi:MAG: hypothetical protein PHI12_09740 [Dehalococcoidales bacterium]|nr:hypothetical protein [Dehalococcoidales bacterium]